MKKEIRRCATMLSKLREDLNREHEDALFEQEQKAKKNAGAEHIRKQA